MSYYAIKDRKTGRFLPAWGRRRGRTNAELSGSAPPRLFRLRHHAETALGWWVKGIATVHYTDDWETGPDEDWRTTSKPEREEADMQIIEVELVEQ